MYAIGMLSMLTYAIGMLCYANARYRHAAVRMLHAVACQESDLCHRSMKLFALTGSIHVIKQ